jgi:hypothetical protein
MRTAFKKAIQALPQRVNEGMMTIPLDAGLLAEIESEMVREASYLDHSPIAPLSNFVSLQDSSIIIIISYLNSSHSAFISPSPANGRFGSGTKTIINECLG